MYVQVCIGRAWDLPNGCYRCGAGGRGGKESLQNILVLWYEAKELGAIVIIIIKAMQMQVSMQVSWCVEHLADESG